VGLVKLALVVPRAPADQAGAAVAAVAACLLAAVARRVPKAAAAAADPISAPMVFTVYLHPYAVHLFLALAPVRLPGPAQGTPKLL
jgi:hypothetical protein